MPPADAEVLDHVWVPARRFFDQLEQLPSRFTAEVHSWAFPTNAGCGAARADGSRAEAPWFATLDQQIDLDGLLQV